MFAVVLYCTYKMTLHTCILQGFLKAAERLQRDRDLYRLIVQNAKHKIQTRHACDREREAYFSLVNRLSVSVKDGRCHTAMNTTAWENGYHAVA